MPDDPSKSDTPQMPTCELCHPDPDTARLAAEPAMPLCVKCHQRMDESRSECTICHHTITRETLPTHRAGVRISHDDPKRWKTEYAKVYRKDSAFCAYCHDGPFELAAEHENIRRRMRERQDGILSVIDRLAATIRKAEPATVQSVK